MLRTTLKIIFSIFRFFCTLRFQIFKNCPNHTSMEILFIQLSNDAWWLLWLVLCSRVTLQHGYAGPAVLSHVCVFRWFLMCVCVCVFQDPDGEHARRVLQRWGRMYGGGRVSDTGPARINIPPSIANNPNIPPEIISALQAGCLGTSVFVADVSPNASLRFVKDW